MKAIRTNKYQGLLDAPKMDAGVKLILLVKVVGV